MRALVTAIVCAFAGCVQPQSNTCADGYVCSANTQCGRAGDRQLCVPVPCGNGRLDHGEACDDGNNISGDGCAADCSAPCGDGLLDPGEMCDDGNAIDGDGCDDNCTLTACGNGIATAEEECDDGNAIAGDGCELDCTSSALLQQAYLKPSNMNEGGFGASVALAADGATLAVGAVAEPSAATGVDGDQANHSAQNAGAVYVFTRRGTQWHQQAYLKASNTNDNDRFGWSLALSADGSTLAVSAIGEASAATGIDGDQANNTAPEAGAVYIFTRNGETWRQQAYVKASNPDAGDNFGYSVALSANGTVLAVGASGEDSRANGVGGDQLDNALPGAGAVYLFAREGAAWRQQEYLKSSEDRSYPHSEWFGASVALSADGARLAVGAPSAWGDAAAGDQAYEAGAVWVFRKATAWQQEARIVATNPHVGDALGISVALSDDGATLAAGAPMADAMGANGNVLFAAGAAYVYTRSAESWHQQPRLEASNVNSDDRFGQCLALSGDGGTLLVTAPYEASGTTGVDGKQNDQTAANSGAGYLFERRGTDWSQRNYLKASNTGPNDYFGRGLAMSRDASTLAIGADGDDSAATGVDGDPHADNGEEHWFGAVFVFH